MREDHERYLVRIAQTVHNDGEVHKITVDGIYGPQTAEAIDLDIFDSVVSQKGSPLHQVLQEATAHWYCGGKKGTNNQSPYIDEMRARAGFPDSDGAWCAIWVSALYSMLAIPIPLSRGAKAITRNTADFLDQGDLRYSHTIPVGRVKEGDCGIASWQRGTGWRGHVRFWVFTGNRFYTLGANEDPGDRVRADSFTPAEFGVKLHQLVRF